MGLRRLVVRHGEELRAHNRIKRYSSFGAATLLFVAFAAVCLYEAVHFHVNGPAPAILVEPHQSVDTHFPEERRLKISKGQLCKVESDSFYPDDLIITKKDGKFEDHKKVGIIVHIIVVGYMLLGLNTVCDIYFCGALDVMVEHWQVKPDVAGATFMAAGGSAPELFTSLIGACITKNDVGFGTIVGSAVFNVLAVIGACGMCAIEPIDLTWWPLARDCTCYIIGLSLLAFCAHGDVISCGEGRSVGGGSINLAEAIILFFAYLGYCTIMYFNEKLEAFVQGKIDKMKGREPATEPEKPSISIVKVAPMPDDEKAAGAAAAPEAPELRQAATGNDEAAPGPPEHHIGRDQASQPSDVPETTEDPVRQTSKEVEMLGTSEHQHHHIRLSRAATRDVKGESNAVAEGETEAFEKKESATEEEEEGDDIAGLMEVPEDTKDKVLWILSLPIYASLYFTIPRPTEKLFMLTFFIALCWIATFSLFLVYCVELFGQAILGGGNAITIVLSFTLLAAGTSIPDLVSSMTVARAGEGDMAVSSSIGSNIFDILVGLPIPWMIKIALVERDIDFSVSIKSQYIVLYVLLLLFMVFCVIVSIHCLGWRLNRSLGYCMAGLYVVFLGVVLPVELMEPEIF